MLTTEQGSVVKESVDDVILMEDVVSAKTIETEEDVDETAKITNELLDNTQNLSNTGKPGNIAANIMKDESFNNVQSSEIDDATSESSDNGTSDNDDES